MINLSSNAEGGRLKLIEFSCVKDRNGLKSEAFHRDGKILRIEDAEENIFATEIAN